MDDLITFWTARLDEIEQVAHEACGHEWSAEGGELYDGTDPRTREQIGELWSVPDSADESYPPDPAAAAHVALNDPQFALADVAADRALLAEYERRDLDALGYLAGLEFAIRSRAARFNGHPDYQAAWAP